MIFGEEQTFAVNCIEVENPGSGGIFLHASLQVGRREIGDAAEICAAGAIAHSATVFLKYAGSRHVEVSAPRVMFEYLQSVMYGENWRIGVSGQFHARFAIHEIFDVSVSDKGWLVFLVDSAQGESVLLVGTRDRGYLDGQAVPQGHVEHVLENMLGWFKRN